jgi:hypothetical protein
MDIIFSACGDGVTPKYHSPMWNGMYQEWRAMNRWCIEQGWISRTDYFADSYIPDGKFYFSDELYQLLFKIRWG